MKKFLLMLLCGVLMLSVVACNDTKDSKPPKQDPPEWEELIDEYDEWATEYVTFQRAFQANPNSPVLMDSLGKWPGEIEEWGKRTQEMYTALNGFKEAQKEYVAELNRISKKIVGGVTGDVTQEELDTFLNEYNAWADQYVAFFEAHKDDKTSEEYRSGLNDLIFQSCEWSNKVNDMTLRIKDSALLTTFTAELAKVSAKIAAAN